MWKCLRVKCRYSCRILIKLKFSRQIFEKKTQISTLIKIRPVEADLFHADGRTDGYDKAKSLFASLRTRLKIVQSFPTLTITCGTFCVRVRVRVRVHFNHGARWGGWLTPRFGHFTPGKRADIHGTGGWVCPTTGVDGFGKYRHQRDSIIGRSGP